VSARSGCTDVGIYLSCEPAGSSQLLGAPERSGQPYERKPRETGLAFRSIHFVNILWALSIQVRVSPLGGFHLTAYFEYV